MSASSSRISPVILGVISLLLIVAVVFGISRLGGSSAAGGDSAETSNESSKNSRQPSDGDSRSKSGGKTEEERRAGAGSAGSKADSTQYFAKLSAAAQRDLAELRKQFAPELDDPENQRAFSEALAQVKDPNERAKMVKARTEEMRIAREKADSAKTPEVRIRETRLRQETQLVNLQRLVDALGRKPDLTPKAEAFSEALMKLADDSGTLDDATFSEEFVRLHKEISAQHGLTLETQEPAPDPGIPGIPGVAE